MKTLLSIALVVLSTIFVSCGSGSRHVEMPIEIPTPTSFTEASFSGDYVLTVSKPHCMMTFHADGLGTITSGDLGCNRRSEGFQTASFTGTYSVASDGRVELELLHTDFTGITPPASFRGVLSSRDHVQVFSVPERAAGTIHRIDETSTPNLSNSSYVFRLDGWTEGSQLNSFEVVSVGRISFGAEGEITGSIDARCGPGLVVNQSFTGTYTPSSGRSGWISVSYGSLPMHCSIPAQWRFVNVTPGHLVFVSTDQEIAAVGEAERSQNTPAPALSGAYVYSYFGSRPNLDGSYAGPVGAIGYLVTGGTEGSIASGEAHENLSGTVSSQVAITGGTYTVEESGRGTVHLEKGTGPAQLVYYAVSPARAFLILTEQIGPYSSVPLGVGTMDRQSLSYRGQRCLPPLAIQVTGSADFGPYNPYSPGVPVAGQMICSDLYHFTGTFDIFDSDVIAGLPLEGFYQFRPEGLITVDIPDGYSSHLAFIIYMSSEDRGKIMAYDNSVAMGGEVRGQ